MNSKKNNGLYDNRFLSIMSWVNSSTVTLIVGGAISLVTTFFSHWILGLIVAFFTVITAISSYITFKK